MTKQYSKQHDTHECCQDIHEDDGIDPRRYFQSSPAYERSRKGLQLCGQVAKLLNEALVGWDSPILASLFVVTVVPAPTLGRLEVVVDTTQVPTGFMSHDIRDELARANRGLRVAVGEGITRKYVPELIFRLAAPREVPQ